MSSVRRNTAAQRIEHLAIAWKVPDDHLTREELTYAPDMRFLLERVEALEAERDGFRIEADCAMRDYDGLELSANEAARALERIANGRPNKQFDPWARELARVAWLHFQASTERQP